MKEEEEKWVQIEIEEEKKHIEDEDEEEEDEEELDEEAVIGDEETVEKAKQSFVNLKKMIVTTSGLYFENVSYCYV